MDYHRQIQTRELSTEILWSELRNILNRFSAAGCKDIQILFGFAWGNKVYEWDWKDITIPISKVESRVKKEEENQYGKLGADDLFVHHPNLPLEVQFCHECDIHIWFDDRSYFVNELEKDWKVKGFRPREIPGRAGGLPCPS